MKRRSRELSIFTLSALDVLATATGTFVLLVVILMPYYRRTHDAQAELAESQVVLATLQNQIEAEAAAGALTARAADDLAQQAKLLTERIESEQTALGRLTQETEAALAQAGDDRRRVQDMAALVQRKLIRRLDVVFVVDTTSSMTDVLYDMNLSMAGIVRVLEQLVASLRVGIVAYRDHDFGSWVTRSLPPTDTRRAGPEIFAFVGSLRPAARGGPSPEEALLSGLGEALTMPLRRNAKQSIIVIGDAAAHSYERQNTLSMARQFARSGEQRSLSTLFVATESYRYFGSDDREFFAALAKAGGGSFNDHEGQLFEAVLLSILDE